MALVWPTKGPDEVLDYEVDWSDRLAGDSIITSSWQFTQTDNAMTIGPFSPSFSTQATTVWLSGGTVGQTYLLLNTITTFAGDTMVETILINVRVK